MCHILVVEDNQLFRQALCYSLKLALPNVSGAQAENALEAMDKFGDLKPRVILLDINLPDGNGLELAKKMRTGDAAAVIFMLTSYDTPEYRSAAQANGANDFFVKGNLSANQLFNVLKPVFAGSNGNGEGGGQSLDSRNTSSTRVSLPR